ncbi:hypothetical protein MRX96_038060 [Rhipicephalus microplus]
MSVNYYSRGVSPLSRRATATAWRGKRKAMWPLCEDSVEARPCRGHCPPVLQRGHPGGHSGSAFERRPRVVLHRDSQLGRRDEPQAAAGRPRGYAQHSDTFHPLSFTSTVECDPPNCKIYRFHGFICHPTGEKVPITSDNLLLRDCVLKNADFVEGIVVYAGFETKAMLNNNGPRYKRSRLERFMNRDIVWCIVILLVLCSVGAIGCALWLRSFENRKEVIFIPYEQENRYIPAVEGFIAFWTYIIILQVMIPLSLYVSIEIIKLGQVFHIHEDIELFDERSNRRLECRALNIPEELGQVQYIFSDKTGTLTENHMVFRRCTIGGRDYNHHHPSVSEAEENDIKIRSYSCGSKPSKDDTVFTLNPQLQRELSNMEYQLRMDGSGQQLFLSPESQRVQEFFLLMATCNTVIVSKYPPQGHSEFQP